MSIGLSFKHSRREVVRMKNSSGAEVTVGDIALLKNTASCDEVSTTAVAADVNLARGGGFMALETISDTAYGRWLRIGFTDKLKVDGTVDIAIGDMLTTVGISGISRRVGSVSHVGYAVALEAYITDDANGVINARLVEPTTGWS